MFRIARLININDGKHRTVMNGDFIKIETFDRESRIISAFLSAGWELESLTAQFSPGRSGGYPFYRDGHDLLFVKSCESEQDDDSQEILEEIIEEIIEESGFEIEDYEED